MKNSDIYLTARQVRERYGSCSDMTLWRLIQDEAMQFPRPLVINGRRFFKISDLEGFEGRQAAKQTFA
jgi:predicted DNA-binding transcriptional regulator AlpA